MTKAATTIELERLTQQQAAWLIGCKPSWLRDRADAPRDADGRYNAKTLVEWTRGQVPAAELDDSEFDRVLAAMEHAAGPYNVNPSCAAFVALCDDLQRKHGDAVLVVMMRELIDAARWSLENNPRECNPSTVEEVHTECVAELERRLRDRTQTIFDVVLRCEDCGKFRHGRRWVTTSPRPKAPIINGNCDKCLAAWSAVQSNNSRKDNHANFTTPR